MRESPVNFASAMQIHPEPVPTSTSRLPSYSSSGTFSRPSRKVYAQASGAKMEGGSSSSSRSCIEPTAAITVTSRSGALSD